MLRKVFGPKPKPLTMTQRRNARILAAIKDIDLSRMPALEELHKQITSAARNHAYGWSWDTIVHSPEIIQAYVTALFPDGFLVRHRSKNFMPFLRGQVILKSVARFLKPLIAKLYQAQEGLCAYCQVKLEGIFHVEHRLPISRGGTDDELNLCCACPTCNLSKHTMTAEEFMVSDRLARIRGVIA